MGSRVHLRGSKIQEQNKKPMHNLLAWLAICIFLMSGREHIYGCWGNNAKTDLGCVSEIIHFLCNCDKVNSTLIPNLLPWFLEQQK